jgi:AN1-type zinc finger protein 5/6
MMNTPDNNEIKTNIQVNINRCMSCNKKIGLMGFQCKCKYYFCTEHRYSDSHNCVFDYKTCGKEVLKNANPQVIPSKINTI